MDSEGHTATADRDVAGVTLDVGGTRSMNTTLWFPVCVISTENFLATTNCPKGVIYVYPLNKNNHSAGPHHDRATRVSPFHHHKSRVHDMAHLFGDVVVSVDKQGKTCIWNVATFKILDAAQAPDYRRLLYVKKLDATSFVVCGTGIRTGNVAHVLYVFSHDGNGRDMKCIKETKLSPGGVLFGTHNRCVYVKTTVKAFKYDIDTARKLSFSNPQIASAYHFEFFAAVNENYIVVSYGNQEMHVHHNSRDCKLIRRLPVRRFSEAMGDSLRAVTIIGANLMMVTTEKYGIFFLNIEGKVLAKIDITKSNDLRSACILSDGRICVAGADAYCGIWKCPYEVKHSVLKYASTIKAKSDGEVKDGESSFANTNGNTNGITNGKDSASEDSEFPKEKEKTETIKTQLAAVQAKLQEERELHTIRVDSLERRYASQKLELDKVQKEKEALKNANKQLRNQLAVHEVRLAVIDAEKEKLAKQLAKERNKEPVAAEVHAALEAERDASRKYKTDMDIEMINMKAQLDVQKVLLKSKDDALEAQKRITERAEVELNRIRTNNPPPKKRKVNAKDDKNNPQ